LLGIYLYFSFFFFEFRNSVRLTIEIGKRRRLVSKPGAKVAICQVCGICGRGVGIFVVVWKECCVDGGVSFAVVKVGRE
jgi:hypothetical protein